MNEEEFLKKRSEGFDSLDLENLRRVIKVIDANSQVWFDNWMRCEREISHLQIENACIPQKEKQE